MNMHGRDIYGSFAIFNKIRYEFDILPSNNGAFLSDIRILLYTPWCKRPYI